MNVNKGKIYKTSDVYFSAYLSSSGFPLKSTESEMTKNEGSKKVVFIFELPENELSRLKALYFGGTGTVPVRLFVDTLRSLKSMCFV